jgi:hypothetical protein
LASANLLSRRYASPSFTGSTGDGVAVAVGVGGSSVGVADGGSCVAVSAWVDDLQAPIVRAVNRVKRINVRFQVEVFFFCIGVFLLYEVMILIISQI